MVHYRALLDPGKYLTPADFTAEGREVTIARVAREKLPARDGEAEQSAPMLYVRAKDGTEYPRPLKVPKSVLHGLSVLFGTETDNWKEKKITVFSAFCLSFGQKEECLRIRFPAEVDRAVRAYLKKRKASPSVYILDENKGQS